MDKLVKFIKYVILIGIGIFMILPFVWMILASLKTPQEIAARPIQWLPATLQWSNYAEAWRLLNFGQLFFNSVIVTALTTIGVIIICSLMGYALSKLDVPGAKIIFLFILSLMMIPFFLMMVPMYVIVQKLNWINNFTGVILPSIAPPFGVFLMRQFMIGIPDELLNAARIDGASEWQIFYKIALPLSRSAIVALGIFALVFHWGNFLWPSLVLVEESKMTIPIGLNQLFDPGTFHYYNIFMAGSTLAIIPLLLAFFFAQKKFIHGIAMTGLKG